jgi:hypothetical protein
MAGITDIVAVTIAIQDSAPKAIEFDTIVVVAAAPFLGSRLYAVSPQGLAAMVVDGFAVHSRAYQIVSRMKAQSGGAAQAYVWGRAAQQTQALEVTVDTTATSVGQTLAGSVSYAGITSPISVTVVANTVDAILDLLEAAIDASLAGAAGIVTTPDGGTGTKLTLSSAAPGTFVQLDGFPRAVRLEDVSAAGTGFAADLAAMKAELGDSVYGLLIDGYSQTEIALAADFALANDMLFLGQSADDEILSNQTDDVATALATAGNTRAGVVVSRYMTGDAAAALMGRQLGQTPGSSNWAMQQLAGVPADVFTDAQHAFARAKHALTYTSDRGEAHTWDGWAASGRYFDITHGVDALKADIETRVYQVFLNSEKVGYNATGRAQIQSAIEAALVAAEGPVGVPGTIEPGWTVTPPPLDNLVDKAARVMRPFLFNAVMTGAANSADVAGTLTL